MAVDTDTEDEDEDQEKNIGKVGGAGDELQPPGTPTGSAGAITDASSKHAIGEGSGDDGNAEGGSEDDDDDPEADEDEEDEEEEEDEELALGHARLQPDAIISDLAVSK